MATPSTPFDVPAALMELIRDQQQFFREVLAQMADVVRLAIGPVAADSRPIDDRPAAAGAPILELAVDDASDPMEVYLGADFLREDSAIYDADDPSPFGVPGLKAGA